MKIFIKNKTELQNVKWKDFVRRLYKFSTYLEGVSRVRRLNAALFTEPPIPINGVQARQGSAAAIESANPRESDLRSPLVIHTNPRSLDTAHVSLSLFYIDKINIDNYHAVLNFLNCVSFLQTVLVELTYNLFTTINKCAEIINNLNPLATTLASK